jgi:hypothetical protein
MGLPVHDSKDRTATIGKLRTRVLVQNTAGTCQSGQVQVTRNKNKIIQFICEVRQNLTEKYQKMEEAVY